MKRISWPSAMLCLGILLCAPLSRELWGQNIVIVTPGPISVGQEVHFRFDQPEGGGDGGYEWSFGDGETERTGNNQAHHAFSEAGTYTVSCNYVNLGGGAPISASTRVLVVDNRRLSAQGRDFRVGQPVRFQSENFIGSSLRWDFGDGTVENGGASRSHAFRQPGSFQVRVWDNSATADSAVRLDIQVAPDDRRLQAAPALPRAGSAVRFTADHFAGSDLRWDFGDGKTGSGGPAMSHVYAAAGSFEVTAWEAGQDRESAVKITLSVQPDVRQLTIDGPPDIFAGTEVVFEGRNFADAALEWDFGDGTVLRSGPRQPHRFQRPGNFTVRVVEGDSGNLPLEKKVQVLKDNRLLELKTPVVFAGSEFAIEARNFRSSQVSWDFGDGPLQTGPRLMKHRYARSGQFRVRAIDFAGRDGTQFEKIIQVENDPRLMRLPGEIIVGEEIPMQLENAGSGSFTWKFSDGDSRSGPEVRAKAFRTPGPHRITVVDTTGKFPPLEKTVQVLPDMRSLKVSSAFILPGEAVTFTAANFKGPGVRWDFGDGTVKENGQRVESHVFQALGRYRVKAVDFNGSSSKPFAVDVVVAEITPGFEIRALEFTFDNGKYYRVMARNSTPPGYRLRIKAKGRGVLSGQFMLDNMSLGLFQVVIQENQAAVLPKSQMPALPVIDLGLHQLTLKFSNFTFGRRMPVIKYFVSDAGAIQIDSPAIDARVPAREKIDLRWSIAQKNPQFEIAVSAVPFEFLEERQVVWLPVQGDAGHRFDPAPFKPGDWIYWQVRLLGANRKVLTTSEIASFRLSE